MPATAIRKVQLGKEGVATWGGGTGIKATVRLIGVTDASLQIADEVYQPESLGYLMPAVNSAQVALSAAGSVNQDVSYQDVCYWLDGVFGVATGSKLAGTQYIYHYVAGTSVIPSPRPYTVEYGAAGAAYRMIGGLVTNLELSVEAGQVWKSTVQLVGKSTTTKNLYSTLAIRSVQLVRAADTTMQVGAWANSTYTAVSATLISASLAIGTGTHLKTFVGSVAPGAKGGDRNTGQLTTVMEFNASAKAYVDSLLAGLCQRRIKIAAATATPLRALDVYFAGTLVEGATLFTDRDGNMTVSLVWNGTYSSTLANWLKIDATNELVSLA